MHPRYNIPGIFTWGLVTYVRVPSENSETADKTIPGGRIRRMQTRKQPVAYRRTSNVSPVKYVVEMRIVNQAIPQPSWGLKANR